MAEQLWPSLILKVGGNQRGLAVVAFFHQFEENIRLLGAQIKIPNFVDQQNIETRPAPDEFARGAIGDGSVLMGDN
jgi:hypothetical protein